MSGPCLGQFLKINGHFSVPDKKSYMTYMGYQMTIQMFRCCACVEDQVSKVISDKEISAVFSNFIRMTCDPRQGRGRLFAIINFLLFLALQTFDRRHICINHPPFQYILLGMKMPRLSQLVLL